MNTNKSDNSSTSYMYTVKQYMEFYFIIIIVYHCKINVYSEELIFCN